MSQANIESLEPPYFHAAIGSKDEFGQYAFRVRYEMHRQKPCSFAIRVLRGEKMKNRAGLFNEFAAAFQFPDYFGENWAALDECLSDLEWIPTEGYAIFISNACSLLSEEDPEDLLILLRLLERVCRYWATEHKTFPSREPNPMPFHVVFHATETDHNFVNDLLKSHSFNASINLLRRA